MIRQRRIPAIDGLRGVAAAGVVAMHVTISRQNCFLLGASGVDLFLVLSGFCLTWRLVCNGEIEPLPIKEYWKRRMRRIVPPFYAAIVLSILMAASIYRFSDPRNQTIFPLRGIDSLLDLLSHLTFTHGLFNRYSHSLNGAFWSLSLEEQFYVFFPLLILIARRWGIAATVSLTALGTLGWWAFWMVHNPDFLWTYVGNSTCLARWIEFGAGMLVAYLVGKKFTMRPIFCIAALTAMAAISHFKAFFGFLGWREGYLLLQLAAFAVGYAALVFQATQPGMIQRILASPPLAGLGQISYSLYLTHLAVLGTVAVFIPQWPGALRLCATLGAVLGFAILFHLAFERPYMRLARRVRPEPSSALVHALSVPQ